jgi:hypothetical protein
MQTFVSVVGVPIQVSFVESNRAPGAPERGPSAASRATMPNTEPSFGATD